MDAPVEIDTALVIYPSSAHNTPRQRHTRRSTMRRFLILALAMASFAASPLSAQGWTLDTAFEQLARSPRDPYLQYLVLQLARRDGRVDEYAHSIRSMSRQDWRRERDQVDLFDLFTGALAVQESLQLDTMRARPAVMSSKEEVDVATLQGPTVTSHPWKKMLGAHEPKLSPLSGMVPEDFYLVEFRSVSGRLASDYPRTCSPVLGFPLHCERSRIAGANPAETYLQSHAGHTSLN